MAFDPTGTTTLRGRYERACVRRIRLVGRMARSAILVDDALGLSTIYGGQRTPRVRSVGFASDAARGQFAGFSHSAAKAKAFADWLNRQADIEVLDLPMVGRNYGRGKHWTTKYLDAGYRKGMRDAAASAGTPYSATALQADFLGPVHSLRAQIIYSRNLEALAGVTEAMSVEIRDVLARGMIEGRGPRELARVVTDRVNKIGIVRARTLARTEIIHAHADASLSFYQDAGLDVVQSMAEFQTSGDDRVCPICAGMEGEEYTIEAARGIIPVHPNCRCRWLPVL